MSSSSRTFYSGPGTFTNGMHSGMPAAAPFRPDAAQRRIMDVPGSQYRRFPNGNGHGPYGMQNGMHGHATEPRKLIVGRDISLCGEIAACDLLIVEGMVEATLRDGRLIEIAETGFFKGTVEIDEADLAGRFEGDLFVRGRMRVRSTGRIHGTIRYGELEVEAGGQIVGTVEVVKPGVHGTGERKPLLAEKSQTSAVSGAAGTGSPRTPGGE